MKIGIIGFGHLGQSLVKGLLFNNFTTRENIFITAKSFETKNKAKNDYKINVCETNAQLIEKTDLIFISIPSKVFFNEPMDLYSDNFAYKTFVSFMAGVTIEKLKETIGDINIIRAMPNLGIENCNGIICYTNTENSYLKDLFNHLGYAFTVEEVDIEKVTAFASCGIGFAAYVLNGFFEAGKQIGFNNDLSAEIVSNIFSNALAASDYSALVSAVATKGGATEAGLDCFVENKMNDIIYKAVEKAYQKMK